MVINVGSKNKVKVGAVEEILKDYPHLAHAHIEAIAAASDVPNQPRSLDETVRGAMNRARNCYNACDFSIGLESGMMHVPHSKTGFLDVCVCAIYDGKEFHFGMSSAWEFPDKSILGYIMNDGLDINQAMLKVGLTRKKNIGSEEGAIGYFTKGRLDRKEYTKQALRTALIHLEESYDN
ncbi:MAG TPA: inosine/xanthosine triphosphatase [Candidatus Paceibacterota bacterium]